MEWLSRWRRLRRGEIGPRLTVLVTVAVGVLSLATGIANIGTEAVLPGGLAALVPLSVQRAAGFTGALTGFLMLGSALGLRRGLRAAWVATVLLVPLTAIQGLVQSSPLSVPLVALSVLALPSLVLNRSHFSRELSLSTTQLAAVVAIVGAQAYGTVGTYALREEFANVATPLDAFYYTLVTASTVGYGDTAPTTAGARLFGMSVIVVGVASFGIALGTLLGPAIEARFSRALGRMTGTQLELLEDHVLVLGYGDLTEPLLEELVDRSSGDVVVITPDSERVSELQDRGYDVLLADPSDDEPLLRANIESARAVVVATNDDASDALAVLTARELNPGLRIVAAATNRSNVEKLRRAGADTVISPAAIGGRLLVRSALDGVDVESAAAEIGEE
ncbi:MAG: NAD-binding protein [Halobacteriaceae archaeon]